MTETPLWELRSDHDVLASYVDLDGVDFVDVGSGAGGLVRFARERGARSLGVECGESMLRQARDAEPDNADAYLEGVGQDLPLEDESADVVAFSYSLHHVPKEHLGAALAEAARVLRPGGVLAVLEPIADGPGHEMFKPIDDETAVRADAQAALDNDLPDVFTELEEIRYTTSYSYADVDEVERHVVDVDESRRALIDDVRDKVTELFEKHGEPHDDRMWFAQPVVMRRFSKH